MKKTGELLKQKRESISLSLSEVALATKINPKILTAIENGDEANLPAKTFLKGFVRSYALFLKMDVDEVMRSFTEETGGPAPQPVHEAYQKPSEPAPAKTSKRKKVHEEGSSGMRTAAVVVIVGLIIAIIALREVVDKYQREKLVPASEVKVTPIAVPPVEPQPKPEEKKTEAKTETPAESKTADVKPEEKKAEEKKPEDKKPEPKTAAKPEPAAEPVASKPVEPPPVTAIQGIPAKLMAPATPPDVKPEPPRPEEKKAEAKPEPKPASKAEPPKPEPAKIDDFADTPKPDSQKKPEDGKPGSPVKNVKTEIILEALDNVEVKFKMHGQAKRVSLGPQQVHTIQSDEPLTLDVSDGGALNVIVNGRERGPAGPLGKAQQVTVP